VLAQLEVLYKQVIAIDPTLARAYSGLAFIHRGRSTRVIAGVRPQPDEEMKLALDFAEKAVTLDPNDARIQCTFGFGQSGQFELSPKLTERVQSK
jgi:adenylate cyclase